MESFERFVEKTNGAKSTEALFSVLQTELNDLGYDKVLFAILSHHREIGVKPGIGINQNYPTDWMNYYFEQGMDRIDPVPRYAAQCSEAFAWEQVGKKFNLSAAQQKCLELGREAGLNHGVGIPLWGARGEKAGISVATSEKKKSSAFHLDLLTAYCNQFYMVFKRLHKRCEMAPVNVHLTPREHEVLCCAARGHKERVIADQLQISPYTVNMNLRTAYEKLGADCRINAVVRAYELGLIDILISPT